MAIKLLALDIDGTLLNSHYEIGTANRRAISRVLDRGIVVVLVTGRRFVIARPIAIELGLHTPLVTHNGALTKNAQTLEVLDCQPLAAQLARRVVELGREVEADLVCCFDPKGFGRALFESVSAENLRLRRYLDRAPMVLHQVSDLAGRIDRDPIQVMSAGPCAKIEQFRSCLMEHLNGQVNLQMTAYQGQNMTILDILAPNCSKARALSAIVDRYGLTAADVMAIGDNHNDLEMLEFARVSVVMGNADEQLKRLGFEVTGTNDEDGVAQAIESFLL